VTSKPPWLRVAGRGRLGNAIVIWSVAEGTRGHRWRATMTIDGGVSLALLIEVDRSDRLVRLELSTAAGLLTLHPSADGREVHGNVVHAAGVRGLAFAWSPEHEFDVIPAPIACVPMLRRLASQVRVGEGETIPVLAIDGVLTVRPATRLVRRLTDERWEVADLAGARSWTLDVDRRGVPRLAAGMEWPLED
jgi:hypothetical protein